MKYLAIMPLWQWVDVLTLFDTLSQFSGIIFLLNSPSKSCQEPRITMMPKIFSLNSCQNYFTDRSCGCSRLCWLVVTEHRWASTRCCPELRQLPSRLRDCRAGLRCSGSGYDNYLRSAETVQTICYNLPLPTSRSNSRYNDKYSQNNSRFPLNLNALF